MQIHRVFGVLHMQHFVRAEGGQHLCRKALILCQEFVVLQIVGGIVCGAQSFYTTGSDQCPGGSLWALEYQVGLFPNGGSAGAVQQFLYTEKPQQFQVGPMVEWVPHQRGHNSRKMVIFFPKRRRTCHAFFRHSTRAHHSPFVVIAGKPGLPKVGKLFVLINFPGIQMAVIVKDGHSLRVLVVEPAGRFAAKQKVVRNKSFHGASLSFPIQCHGSYTIHG